MSLKRTTGKAQATAQDYAPVIFPLEKNIPFAPLLTSGSSSKKTSNGPSYMERLAQTHKALARMAREETQSVPQDNLNIDAIASDQRTSALRALVWEAITNADGNTADGKYNYVTQLLRLNSTSGRNGRWSTVRTDLSPPEELKGAGLGWINAKTEAEWKEWERKYEAERRVKDKVENWKKTVEPPSKDNSLQQSLETPAPKALSRLTGSKTSVNLVSIAADPLKSATPFGFSVVKRHKHVAGKPSGSGRAKEPKDKIADDAHKLANNAHKKHIADLPELSFIPPSFPPSQLVTSTPKHAAKPTSNPRKPDPIPHIAEPSSDISIVPETSQHPPFSPRVIKIYGRHNPSPGQPLEASASLPAIPIPSTPTRNRGDNHHPHTEDDDDSLFNANNKRIFASPINTPDNKERALKRARTLSDFPHSPSTPPPMNRQTPQQARTSSRSPRTPMNGNRIVPTTAAATSSPLSPLPSSNPKKQAVPTLTELLASAKKSKKKLTAAKPPSKGKAKQSKETPFEETDSDNVPRLPRAVSPVGPFLFPRTAVLAGQDKEDDSVHADFHDLSEERRDLPQFDPYAILDPSAIPGDGALSPAKSLSSLAGSDSEDEDEDQLAGGNSYQNHGFFFKPLATSTQQGPFTSTNLNDGGKGPFGASAGGGMIKTQESQPAQQDLPLGTKDSWDSIYAPPSGLQSKSKSKSPESQPRHYKLPPSSGVSTNPFAYNSQFATGVAKSVYDVDKLLEQDVEQSYSGWIQDPYADEIEDYSGYGQNGSEPDSSP